jgi:hypothetical protein
MKILEKLWKWIEGLFSKLDELVDKMVPVAVSVTEGVKNALDNDKVMSVIEIVKFAIPGDTDDKIIDKAIELAKLYVPKIAIRLEIIDSIAGIENQDEQMLAVVNALKDANDNQKSDYWHELAAFVLKKLSDDKITLGEAGAIAEYHYQNYVKPKIK